ncbi:hypothetical protein Acsp07_03780 [Actinomycetospora sp. NBRC 106378]|nr:hypothetical protein Acsp07_03780 [Actinomycetospora sp. NBRC 106378]
MQLPVPEIGVGAGESTDVGHLDHLLVLTRVAATPGSEVYKPDDASTTKGGPGRFVTVRACDRAQGDRAPTL